MALLMSSIANMLPEIVTAGLRVFGEDGWRLFVCNGTGIIGLIDFVSIACYVLYAGLASGQAVMLRSDVDLSGGVGCLVFCLAVLRRFLQFSNHRYYLVEDVLFQFARRNCGSLRG